MTHRHRRTLHTVVLGTILLALLATVMMPALDARPADGADRELSQAVHAHLQDFPPPAPASAIGDHFYTWSHAVCPAGEYHAPQTPRPSSD